MGGEGLVCLVDLVGVVTQVNMADIEGVVCEVIYEDFIFSNEKQLLDMGLSHFNDRINCFVLAEKAEIYSGTDKPIFIYKSKKDMVKKKNRSNGKGKEAVYPMSLPEVRGIWFWVGVSGFLASL